MEALWVQPSFLKPAAGRFGQERQGLKPEIFAIVYGPTEARLSRPPVDRVPHPSRSLRRVGYAKLLRAALEQLFRQKVLYASLIAHDFVISGS
jgi:hypothetical protein